MKKLRSGVIVVFLIATVALYVCVFVIPGLAGAMRKTAVLEFGRLSLSDEVTAYFVRKETVYLAGADGAARYYVGEGVKIRKGERPMDILPAEAPALTGPGVYAELTERLGGGAGLAAAVTEKGGVLSYFVDGYEKVFSPERLDFLTKAEAEAASGPALNLTRHEGSIVKAGEPVYKLVDDSLWYLAFWLPKDSGGVANYAVGERVAATLPRGELFGVARRVADQGDCWQVVLEFDRYYEGLALARKTDATMLAGEYDGLLVDNASITAREGQAGVYVKGKGGDFAFVPVKIKKSDGKRSAVWDTAFTGEDGKRVATVRAYDEILLDPAQAGG
ncbi:MAG: hypothetical protein LBG71_05000 [Clostridiales Family XIII bacterium]|jgi:putative membrane fusion protein|nr:hypothetical protein [Clostridiales Family XIII bacterium]